MSDGAEMDLISTWVEWGNPLFFCMQPFRKILFYVDPHQPRFPAFRRVLELVRENQAAFSLATVVPNVSERVSRCIPGYSSEEIVQLLQDNCRRLLRETLKELTPEDGPVQTCLLSGEVAEALSAEVEAGGYELLIKPRQCGSGTNQYFSQTENLRLLRRCPCGVWIMHPEDHHQYHRILTAIDPDPDTPTAKAVNRRALDIAFHLAERDHDECHVVSAWEMLGEHLVSERLAHPQFQSWRLRKCRQIQNKVRNLLDQFGIELPDHQLHFIKGDPLRVLSDFEKELRVDTLIIGMLGRRGLPGMVLHEKAEAILDRIHCSLLVVKPFGQPAARPTANLPRLPVAA